jgi:hypothetical protein
LHIHSSLKRSLAGHTFFNWCGKLQIGVREERKRRGARGEVEKQEMPYEENFLMNHGVRLIRCMDEDRIIRLVVMRPLSRRHQYAGAMFLPGIFRVIPVMMPLVIFMRVIFIRGMSQVDMKLLLQVVHPMGAGGGQNEEKKGSQT